MNPFGNFAGPPPPLYVGGDVNNPVIAPQPTPASFYLIPAAAAGFFLFIYSMKISILFTYLQCYIIVEVHSFSYIGNKLMSKRAQKNY